MHHHNPIFDPAMGVHLWSVFVLSLAASLHCVGMCGPLVVLAESLRVAVGARPFEVTTAAGSGELLKVTVSVGAVVSDARADSAMSSPEQLVKSADKALRAAKEAGRNQVRVFRSDSGLAAA